VRALGALHGDAASAVPDLQKLYGRARNRGKHSEADVVTIIEILDTIAEIGDAGGDIAAAVLVDACSIQDSAMYNPLDVGMFRLTGTKALSLFFGDWSRSHSAKVSKCPLSNVPFNYRPFQIRLDLRKQEEGCLWPEGCTSPYLIVEESAS
jgi:hypothetical protein